MNTETINILIGKAKEYAAIESKYPGFVSFSKSYLGMPRIHIVPEVFHELYGQGDSMEDWRPESNHIKISTMVDGVEVFCLESAVTV